MEREMKRRRGRESGSGRESISLKSSVSWVRVPSEQLFFIFYGKGGVQVSCIALFMYSVHTIGLRDFIHRC